MTRLLLIPNIAAIDALGTQGSNATKAMAFNQLEQNIRTSL